MRISDWSSDVCSSDLFSHTRVYNFVLPYSGIIVLDASFPSGCRIVVLISGRGSNMQTIVNTVRAQALPAQICAVIANKADAGGLAWADSQGIPTGVVAHRDYAQREDFDTALADAIEVHQPHYVFLAGFMRVFKIGRAWWRERMG